jgi:hypothetical protein
MFSGLPPIATDARIFWIGSVVPQADICGAANRDAIRSPVGEKQPPAQGEVSSSTSFGTSEMSQRDPRALCWRWRVSDRLSPNSFLYERALSSICRHRR